MQLKLSYPSQISEVEAHSVKTVTLKDQPPKGTFIQQIATQVTIPKDIYSRHLLLGLLAGTICVARVVFGASIVLRLRQLSPAAVPLLVGFAAGTLLGIAFWSLLPEAAGTLSIKAASGFALFGVSLFLLMEKGVRFFGTHQSIRPPLKRGYLP